MAAAGAAALVAGCAALLPESPPLRYHALAAGEAPRTLACDVRFGVRPVALPGYLDRDEILVERKGTEMVYAGSQVWASPLRAEVSRTLAAALAARWTGSRMVAYPWRFAEAPPWAVDAAFEQLDPVAGSLQVRARWSLVATDTGASAAGSAVAAGGTTVATGRLEARMPLTETGAAGTADALSRAVAELADRIAAEGRAALGTREPGCR
jgi:uncharacterized lipoprotein YmbA